MLADLEDLAVRQREEQVLKVILDGATKRNRNIYLFFLSPNNDCWDLEMSDNLMMNKE